MSYTNMSQRERVEWRLYANHVFVRIVLSAREDEPIFFFISSNKLRMLITMAHISRWSHSIFDQHLYACHVAISRFTRNFEMFID